MPIKIKAQSKRWYDVPSEFTDSDDKVRLAYQEPSIRKMVTELGKLEQNGKIKISQAQAMESMLNILDSHIVGWEGIVNEDGNILAFDKDLLQFLPLPVQLSFVQDILLPVWQEISTSTNLKQQKENKELENIEDF